MGKGDFQSLLSTGDKLNGAVAARDIVNDLAVFAMQRGGGARHGQAAQDFRANEDRIEAAANPGNERGPPRRLAVIAAYLTGPASADNDGILKIE